MTIQEKAQQVVDIIEEENHDRQQSIIIAVGLIITIIVNLIKLYSSCKNITPTQALSKLQRPGIFARAAIKSTIYEALTKEKLEISAYFGPIYNGLQKVAPRTTEQEVYQMEKEV